MIDPLNLILFVAQFCVVTISAFQQKCAVGDHYVVGAVVAFLRKACDWASWGIVGTTFATAAISETYQQVFYMGTGAALGFVCGVYAHNRLFKKDKH